MNSYDQEKKYTKRPLCVVYYDVDFGFEQRTGWLGFVVDIIISLDLASVLLTTSN